MQLSWQPLPLQLIQPFRIAHGTSSVRHNVLVRLGEGLAEGLGEAAAVHYHGETPEGIVEYLRSVDLSEHSDPAQLEDILSGLPVGSAAARAGIDIALHDAWGRALGQPLYRLFGLNPERIPLTSFTIPLGSVEEMVAQARAADAPLLKIKLGAGAEDRARIAALRSVTSVPLRVDANAGWTLAGAEALLPELAEHGVELVEQPLPVGDLEGLRRLSRLRSRPPLFADESIKSAADILAHHGLVEGVVVKLAKSGGIRGALQQITLARSLGLDVMLSCMIESSVAVTAAAHLAPLCQYVDLDGPLLIANDPYQGVTYQRGRLRLPARPGLGLLPVPPAP
ncbi:MAG TPA: dipeptide epimerase [Polyangiaceae bacterium]|nr:dipeptide epimerase [Polyangiaceae bacterium]